MRSLVQTFHSEHSPESVAAALQGEPGVVLLRSALFDAVQGRYSFVTARPFLTFRSFGSQCEIEQGGVRQTLFGDPWCVLSGLIARYELTDELDLPFPLGGCFGYWGYDLKDSLESCLTRRAINDLELPDCHVGFYESVVVFDHALGQCSVISTGLDADGVRNERAAATRLNEWALLLEGSPADPESLPPRACSNHQGDVRPRPTGSTMTREEYLAAVRRAKDYIRAGDIYQVNLAHRFSAPLLTLSWDFWAHWQSASPAPFAAYIDCGRLQVLSDSPEQFLRISGSQIRTRPIKGTRPRSPDAEQDTRLSYELQTSAKEQAELVMITDLLRNDLGRVSEFGSVHVPELFKLERYAHVQHLVSTVEGRLRPNVTHLDALAACFPGGSVTGAPKIRAMQIIDELEPVSRGPYTGAIGYLGFNRESQLNIAIRTAVAVDGQLHFHAGSGIVADSDPEAEYEETLVKARGFLNTLGQTHGSTIETNRNDLHRRLQP